MWHVSSRSGVTALRTAIHLLLTYLQVTDMSAVLYIASLWLKPRLSVVLSSAGYTGGSTDSKPPRSAAAAAAAEGRPSAAARCDASGRDTEWYLATVATDLVLPSPDAVKFGMLRVSTGRCARLLPATGRIALRDCLRDAYVRPPREMTFELTREGQLKVTGTSTSIAKDYFKLRLIVLSVCYSRRRDRHRFHGPLSGSTQVSRYQKGNKKLSYRRVTARCVLSVVI